MALCKDEFVKQLEKLSFSVVKLPRAGIQPLQVIGLEGGISSVIGKLEDIWSSNSKQALPSPTPEPAANIQLEASSTFGFGLGFKFLAPVLKGMGVDGAKLRAAYRGATGLRFVIEKPILTKVSLTAVGTYLGSGDAKFDNPIVEKFFVQGSNRLYVITETLASKSMKIIGFADKQTQMGADVDAAQAAAIKAAVDVSSAQSGALTYEGKTLLVFAFKAYEISIEDGRIAFGRVKLDLTLAKGTTPTPEVFSVDTLPVLMPPARVSKSRRSRR